MKIIPKRDFRHAGYAKPALIAGKKYNATPAGNIPNAGNTGAIFVTSSRKHCGPAILLEKGDYDVILPIDRRDAPRNHEARLRRYTATDRGPCCGCAYRGTKCYNLPEFLKSGHSCLSWKRKDGREVVFVKRKRRKE